MILQQTLTIYICCLSWHIYAWIATHTAISRSSNEVRTKCCWWWFTTYLAFAAPTKRYSQILIFLPYPSHFAGVDLFPRVRIIFRGLLQCPFWRHRIITIFNNISHYHGEFLLISKDLRCPKRVCMYSKINISYIYLYTFAVHYFYIWEHVFQRM